MELRDAIHQISAIRVQLARTEGLRSLGAVPVAFSGALALGAALAQTLWIPDPAAQPRLYLLLWTGAAAIGALAAGLGLLARTRRHRSSLGGASARLAVEQFAPCLLAGSAITAFVLLRRLDLLWLLPGLWQLLFGLGLLAAHRLLPGPVVVIGAGYLATGTLGLYLADGALQPWVMGGPFAVGQFALATILWWSHERRNPAEVRR